VLELTDPRAMRALAHPVRIALLELIHERGTVNATEGAREVGGSPQACSYHLRALAKWGIVRRTASADGRETRWQRASRAIRFSSGPQGSPGAEAATDTLKTMVLARDDRIVSEFLARERELPPEWREAATLSSGFLQLTADELEEVNRRISEATLEFAHRTSTDRPEGARRVDVMFRAIPKVGD
jgi:DNA-binding transcriptional ArsR family regulator